MGTDGFKKCFKVIALPCLDKNSPNFSFETSLHRMQDQTSKE